MTRSEGDPPSLLVVDDDETLRARLVRAFRERGYEAAGAPNGAEAVELARAEAPELAVVDLRMEGLGGLEVIKELFAIDPGTRVVVLTGYGSIATAVEAMRLGAKHYLTKPADADQILQALGDDPAPPGSGTETPSLARTEWEHIQRVLTEVDGNVSEAARRLGLHRRSLQRKLSRYPPGR